MRKGKKGKKTGVMADMRKRERECGCREGVRDELLKGGADRADMETVTRGRRSAHVPAHSQLCK